MPTSLRSGPYRFYFFAGDRGEPVHTHVQRDACMAKFWLSPVRLAANFGFGAAELRQLERLTEQNENRLMEAWHDFFSADE